MQEKSKTTTINALGQEVGQLLATRIYRECLSYRDVQGTINFDQQLCADLISDSIKGILRHVEN